jgi:hypothetical protein
MTEQVGAAFDPSKYLTKVGNADYLEVKWRLVWLRQRYPDAEIDTAMVEIGPDYAIFRAVVTLPTGGSASGWGSETQSDFRDFIEKAETKAIGRALAALGFGTQFCPDFDFEGGGASPIKIVDSPIDFASTRGRRLAGAGHDGGERKLRPPSNPDSAQTVTARQLKFIQAIARECGLDEAAIRADVQESFGCGPEDLGRREASEYIERLQSLRNTNQISS